MQNRLGLDPATQNGLNTSLQLTVGRCGVALLHLTPNPRWRLVSGHSVLPDKLRLLRAPLASSKCPGPPLTAVLHLQGLEAGNMTKQSLGAGLDPTLPSHGRERHKGASCICVGGSGMRFRVDRWGLDAMLGQVSRPPQAACRGCLWRNSSSNL
jgi:hypothetical protein